MVCGEVIWGMLISYVVLLLNVLMVFFNDLFFVWLYKVGIVCGIVLYLFYLIVFEVVGSNLVLYELLSLFDVVCGGSMCE